MSIFDNPLANVTMSDEEMYFTWYLDELQEHGYVKSWKRADPIPLFNTIKAWYLKVGAKKSTAYDRTLLKAAEYTPDYEITWTDKARGVLFNVAHSNEADAVDQPSCFFQVAGRAATMHPYKSIVEVKGGFTESREVKWYSILVKWAYHNHGIYVQKLEVSNKKTSVFARTFCPRQFRLTNKTGKPRSLKFEPRSLAEFAKAASMALTVKEVVETKNKRKTK